MSRVSEDDLGERETLPKAEDSFGDVDDLDPVVGDFVRDLLKGPTGPSEPEGRPPDISIGSRLAEHFQVLRRIGSGGMGVVVLARDLRLDREVAIKVVGSSSSEQAAARLQREAQAMAQLAHPNVVAVHEVGTVGGSVYIAMEYVDGGTARTWARSERRTWAGVLDVYLQAARGLAAAHAAGLVHRDFKPDNVLVGKDGRVRVADFGLARSRMGADSQSATAGSIEVPADHASFQHATLTATDAVVGTPGYMAPEQFANKNVGPAVDQFAFAVALWEALFGDRPYGPHAALPEEELVLRPTPPERRVPKWLRRALVHALAPKPEDRFVDMQALVRALEAGRARGGRIRVAALACGGAAIVAAVGLGIGRELRTDPCEGAAAGATEVWSDVRAAAIASAVARTDTEAGPLAWGGLRPRVAAWIGEWSQARVDSCTATRVDASRSDVLLDRSFACFDERLREVDAWLRLLEEGDRAAVHAIGARDVLPSLGACGDTQYLLAQVDRPSDPKVATRVDELTAALIDIEVRFRAGDRRRARQEIDGLREAVEATGYEPLLATWLVRRGHMELAGSDFADAQRDLHAGYVAARTAGDDGLAAAAARDLAFLHGIERREIDVARVWLDHVEIDIARGAAPVELRVAVAAVEVVMAGHEGRYEDAIAHGENAVALADAQLGEFARIEARKALAEALDGAGRHTEAIAMFEEVLATLDAMEGASSLSREPVYSNLGLAYYQMGRYDEAIAMHEKALARAVAGAGEDHVDLWTSELNLGLALVAAERYDEGAKHLERSRALIERLGPDFDADRALVISSLGWLAERRGELEEALVIYRDALALHRRTLPPTHPEIALQLTRQAEILVRLKRHEDAAPLLDEAMKLWSDPAHATNPRRTETWIVVARLARDRGQIDAAREQYAAIVELGKTADLLPEIVKDAQTQIDALPPR
jgi:eukaryotic-like serine/threonine-protein kinase